MNFLQRIQQRPEWVRRTILWAIVIIVGLALGTNLVMRISKSFKQFPKEKIIEKMNIPTLGEKIREMGGKEMDFLNLEELKKIGESLENVTGSNEEIIEK